MERKPPQADNDIHKGAIEDDHQQANTRDQTNTTMRGQLPHRTSDAMIKANDTDYPEPGENPEHTGEPEENPEAQNQTQQPGHRQKENQNWRREDPLAS